MSPRKQNSLRLPQNRLILIFAHWKLKSFCASLSFVRLCDMVDHVFPVLDADGEANFPHPDTLDDCNAWNKELCDTTSQEKEEDLQGTSWGNGINAWRLVQVDHFTGDIFLFKQFYNEAQEKLQQQRWKQPAIIFFPWTVKVAPKLKENRFLNFDYWFQANKSISLIWH